MDYDKTSMPEGYDAARTYQPDVMADWMDRIVALVPVDGVEDIVDLGCGTGRYTAALAERYGARVFGIEPSEKMLAQARAKHGDGAIRFGQGGGEALPAADGSADLIFLSMVYHHLSDPAATARECRRVLRPGGRLCIRNSTQDRVESFPHLRFFPAVREIVARTSPSVAGITGAFEGAGFEVAGHEVVRHRNATNWASQRDNFARRADSFLARLADADYERGMAELDRHCETAPPDDPVWMDIDLLAFRVPATSAA